MWAFPKVLALGVVGMYRTAAQQPPFPFGTATGDVTFPLGYGYLGNEILLPKPMMLFGNALIAVTYDTNGYLKIVAEIGPPGKLNGFANVYFTALDTSNGGTDQNQIWFRVGNKTSDLNLARDIIAGNGTLFNPQVVMVATLYTVEAYYQRAGPKNTFQLIMAYSDTGATYGIHAYTQLQFFQSASRNVATVEYINDFGVPFLSIATVNSNSTMNQLKNGTNCNRTGIYVYQINAGSTKAPTKSPTKAPTTSPTKAPTKSPTKAPITIPTAAPAPTKCGLFGWSIFCPFTFCGWLGRWFGFCGK